MTELDASGVIAGLALLLSFRQDALAAKDLNTESTYRLKLASALGVRGGDWPISLRLAAADGDSEPVRWSQQRNPLYLATALPPAFRDAILAAAKSHGIEPALLYSVMYHESHFDAGAVSVNQALGLFQFIPDTFEDLNERWKLLGAAPGIEREQFLFDPSNSIDLGARWFKELLLPNYAGREAQIAFALMEHNIGGQTVKSWINSWDAEGRSNDVEYIIDTVFARDTRRLVREVVNTLWLIQASGTLGDSAGAIASDKRSK
jgi:soluble lytic murein transglycosylase-like protein